MRARRWPVLLLATALLGAGCGVEPQDEPEEIEVSAVPDAAPLPGGVGGTSDVTLYFVRGSRLEAVERPSHPAGPQSALRLLAAGPTPDEVATGLRTALLPQPLAVETAGTTGDTVTVVVSREFTAVTGGDQLRAVAQVVFTVTALPAPRQVRFATDEGPVEVPTDEGLTVLPVDRDDFASVAPLPDPATTPDGGQPDGQPPPTPPTGPPPGTPPGPATAGSGGRRPARPVPA